MRGFVTKAQAENSLARQRNYELATLVAYAFHDPKNIPKFSDGSKEKEIPDEVAQAQVRGYFMALAKSSGS